MARPSTGTVQWFGDHWRARVTLPDGSRPWLDLPRTIAQADEAQAKAKARELAAFVREHGYQRADDGALVGDNETVREYAERWLNDRERRGFRSVKDDRQRLNTHAFPLVGDVAVRAVTARELRALVASLDDKTRAGALAATTARKAWGLVAKLFTDAQSSKVEALRVRDDNPASGVAPPDGGHTKAKAYLYPSEFLALVACEAIALRFRRLYALAVYTYCRAGELEALQVEDVDLEHGTVHVHRAVAHSGEVRETKTGETRRVRLEPTLRPLLEALMRGRTGGDRVIALPSREDGAAMLRRHLQLAGVTRAELYADDATRIPLTFHDLRATGITWRAVRGDDPLKIQRDAGHRDLATTQRYIREASVYGDGFGDVFPELPASLLTDGPGAPGGGGGEGADRRRSRARTRGPGALAREVSSIESSNAPDERERSPAIRHAERATANVLPGRDSFSDPGFSRAKTTDDMSALPPKHPVSSGFVHPLDDCGTKPGGGWTKPPDGGNPRAALVAQLGAAVRAGLEGGDALLVRVAARALSELVDPGDGPVIDLASERARRGG